MNRRAIAGQLVTLAKGLLESEKPPEPGKAYRISGEKFVVKSVNPKTNKTVAVNESGKEYTFSTDVIQGMPYAGFVDDKGEFSSVPPKKASTRTAKRLTLVQMVKKHGGRLLKGNKTFEGDTYQYRAVFDDPEQADDFMEEARITEFGNDFDDNGVFNLWFNA